MNSHETPVRYAHFQVESPLEAALQHKPESRTATRNNLLPVACASGSLAPTHLAKRAAEKVTCKGTAGGPGGSMNSPEFPVRAAERTKCFGNRSQYSNENPFAPIGREAETTRCGGLNFRARQPPPPPPGAPPAGATSAPARTPESVRCGLKKAPAGSVEDRCNEVLDAFHADAARGDAERYFAHLAPNFVFLGTDANERWDRANFERYARDRFRTKGWTYVVVARHAVQHAKDVVSFDEALTNDSLGNCRSTGLLLKQKDGAFKLAQYSLSVPIPNDMVLDVATQISAMRPGSLFQVL